MGDGSSDMQYVNADNAKTTALETILRYRFGFGLILTGSYAYTNDYEEVDGRNTSLVRQEGEDYLVLCLNKAHAADIPDWSLTRLLRKMEGPEWN